MPVHRSAASVQGEPNEQWVWRGWHSWQTGRGLSWWAAQQTCHRHPSPLWQPASCCKQWALIWQPVCCCQWVSGGIHRRKHRHRHRCLWEQLSIQQPHHYWWHSEQCTCCTCLWLHIRLWQQHGLWVNTTRLWGYQHPSTACLSSYQQPSTAWLWD